MIHQQINKARQFQRKDLLSTKDKTPKNNTILAVTYNKNLPNLKKALDDNWNILSINPNITLLFTEKTIIAFRRNQNLQQLICKHKLHNNKPIIKKDKKIKNNE